MRPTCHVDKRPCDGQRCRMIGLRACDFVRDDSAATLVPHAVWGDAWITPWLPWMQLDYWRAMHARNDG